MQRIKRKLPIIGALIIMCAAVYLSQGCASVGTRPSVCDTITEPSLLCEYSAEIGVRLEDVGTGLIVANAANIGLFKLYTTEQAVKVMKEIRAILDNPVSYAYFKGQIDQRLSQYPGLLQVAEAFFDTLGAQTQIMYRTDRDILIGFLDKQIEILGSVT